MRDRRDGRGTAGPIDFKPPRLGSRPQSQRMRPERAVDPARDVALAGLAAQARVFPDLTIAPLDTEGLLPLDEAFAHAVYDAAIRRWLTIRYLIDRMLQDAERKVDHRAMGAMIGGAAQLLFLDRVPAHAAVDTSVEWAKAKAGGGAARLVNAVLRRIAELVPHDERRRPTYSDGLDELPAADGGALVLAQAMMPPDPMQRLSVATSVPIDLLRSWSKNLSLREARRLAMHTLVQPPIILNTAHAQAPLPRDVQPHNLPGHHVFTGPHASLVALLRDRGDVWVQDPASSLGVGSVLDLTPKLVVDACAGMGTKTRQLAAAFPNARIIATDVDLPRVKALRASATAANVEVVAYGDLVHLAGKADLVLLDVPCSNTGVLARRVEARYRFDREHLDRLKGMQRQIIADSIRLLRRASGSCGILYSTCSLDQNENHEQAVWASRWHGLGLAREHVRQPEGLPGDGPERYSDGSYAVLLQ